jgi:isoquinoline 1-oxidoreductase subunit alpha
MPYSLLVNGTPYTVDVAAGTPLLWVLRDTLGLSGTKYGCGVSLCGSCTVHLDGVAVRSCAVPIERVGPRAVTTIEGLSPDGGHPLQRAWVQEDVPQCGYCQPGMLMAAAALLRRKPRPSDRDIDEAITNLCRCGTYQRVRRAIKRAAALRAAATRVEARYELPYLAHATLEPMNATAHVKPDAIEIWVPTQSPGMVQTLVAQVFGLPPRQVRVHVTFVGGGFGRRGNVDYALEAALVSQAAGAPVQVLWSREEDMRHDFYRPATAIHMAAGLDAAHRPMGLTIKHASTSIAARLIPGFPQDRADPIAQQGFADSPYEFPARRIDYVMTNLRCRWASGAPWPTPTRRSPWNASWTRWPMRPGRTPCASGWRCSSGIRGTRPCWSGSPASPAGARPWPPARPAAWPCTRRWAPSWARWRRSPSRAVRSGCSAW